MTQKIGTEHPCRSAASASVSRTIPKISSQAKRGNREASHAVNDTHLHPWYAKWGKRWERACTGLTP